MVKILTDQHLERFLSKARRIRLLIVGDLILDHFMSGVVRRISPEAPVPVLEVKKQIYRCGGAGNVCLNITGLGARATIASIIGDDSNGSLLRNMLEENNVDTFVLTRRNFPTSIKTRVIAGSQQMIRVDNEQVEKMTSDELAKMKKFFCSEIDNFDAVIISDYGKGVIVSPLISYLVRLCHSHKKIITVDPKIDHFFYYKDVDCLTPNLTEASAGMHMSEPVSDDGIISLGKKIIRKLRSRGLIITRGKDGMSIFSDSGIFHLPAISKEVFDVTGAGDTVIAVLTLALSCGFDLLKSAIFANIAAAVVVQKLGTANVSPQELRTMFPGYKPETIETIQ